MPHKNIYLHQGQGPSVHVNLQNLFHEFPCGLQVKSTGEAEHGMLVDFHFVQFH